MRGVAKGKGASLAAAIAAAGLVLTPAIATGMPAKKRPAPVTLSFDPISSFTPANADPKLAAALAGKGLALTDFKFTPAPAKGRPSQVRVAIRARVVAPAETRLAEASAPAAAVSALTPTGYNLGVAVGWRRFAVSGDVAKVKGADPAVGGRESAVVGVSYSLKKFTGRVAVGADRPDGRALPALRRGDTLVLCSDGLSGQVSKDDISAVVSREQDLTTACRLLIDRANENGGPDNITVIVARFEGAGLRAPPRRAAGRPRA